MNKSHQLECRVQLSGTPWHCSNLSRKADTSLSNGCLTMSRLVTCVPPRASSSRVSTLLSGATCLLASSIICRISEPPVTGATTLAWSFGWLGNKIFIFCYISFHRLLRIFSDELLDLSLGFSGQVQEVVTPVGGGGLVHGAPHQGPGLKMRTS